MNPSVTEVNASAKYKIHPIWTMNVKGVETVILTLGEVIVLGVLLAMLIAVVVLMLKKREKTVGIMRAYESEAKRITWLSWKDTKKSTIVVLIGLAVCTIVICVLDLGLSEGFLQFVKLFQAK
jgi:preprotein translocase SecE subunit